MLKNWSCLLTDPKSRLLLLLSDEIKNYGSHFLILDLVWNPYLTIVLKHIMSIVNDSGFRISHNMASTRSPRERKRPWPPRSPPISPLSSPLRSSTPRPKSTREESRGRPWHASSVSGVSIYSSTYNGLNFEVRKVTLKYCICCTVNMYAEVESLWGHVVRLRIASYTMMRLPNREIKTEDIFEGFVFTFIGDSENQNNSTKASGFQNTYFFFNVWRVTPGLIGRVNKRALLIL